MMRDLRRRNLHRTTCRCPRSCCRRLGGRPHCPRRPRQRCRGALAEDSPPSFSSNRVQEGQSQISPSSDSLFNVSPLSPIDINQEKEMPKPEFNDSALGEPISYARLEQTPGSE